MDQCVDLTNQTLAESKALTRGCTCAIRTSRQTRHQRPLRPAHASVGKGTSWHNLNGIRHPSRRRLSVAGSIPRERAIGLRLHDHCDLQMETPAEVVARVEGAMRYVDKKRIHAASGLRLLTVCSKPYGSNGFRGSVPEAQAMCQAAALLRQRYA